MAEQASAAAPKIQSGLWDSIKVASFGLRIVALVLTPLFLVFCLFGVWAAPMPIVKLVYAGLGVLFIQRLVSLVRVAKGCGKIERSLKEEEKPPISVVVPLSQLGIYFECSSEQSEGWWDKEAHLIRAPALMLERAEKTGVRMRIGLPLIAALSDPEARWLMTYKVARLVGRDRGVDGMLERVHKAANRRAGQARKKQKEKDVLPAGALWATLARHCVRAAKRNDERAKASATARWGGELERQTLETVSRMQKAWPMFEAGTLFPLLHMGGIPPVIESLRAFFAPDTIYSSAGALRTYERELYSRLINKDLLPVERGNAYAELGPPHWARGSAALRNLVGAKSLRDLPELIAQRASLFLAVAEPGEDSLPAILRACRL